MPSVFLTGTRRLMVLWELDCMYVQWKNYHVAFQGAYMGKESTSQLYHNLCLWHTAFGFAGSWNDIGWQSTAKVFC